MSKQIKQMQMDVLEKTFKGVPNMVFLTASKIDSQTENRMRLDLRKKNVRLHQVKNSLLRRVFNGMGVKVADETWSGPTIVAWGGESVKQLSKEVETYLKDDKLKTKLKVKSAYADGQALTFEKALTMPTRQEAIADVVAAFLGAGSGLVAALTGPASQIASQIQTIAEKKEDAPAAPA